MKRLWVLFLLVGTGSCSGQSTGTSFSGAVPADSVASGLVKTQGSNQYATVSCAVQDHAGHLWFGTSSEGLYCYNDKGFTHFTAVDGLTNTIRALVVDTSGTLWVGGKSALYRYDGKGFTAIPLPVPNGIGYQIYRPGETLTAENELWSLLKSRNGTLWLGTAAGVYRYNGRYFSRFLDDTGLSNPAHVSLKSVQHLYEDREGRIWLSSSVPANEGVCCYDGNILTQFKPYGEGWVRQVLEYPSGQLLFVTRHHGVCRLNGRDFINMTQTAGIDDRSVSTALIDASGTLWLGTELGSGQLGEEGGLWRYDGHTFKQFTTRDGLVHNGVFSLLQDRSGTLWIGTRNTGLCRYDGTRFTRFSQ